MSSAIITIDDVLGPFQERKVFSDKAPASSDVEMALSDEDAPQRQRTCKQCNSGRTMSDCECQACEAWRAFGDKLANKRSMSWTPALDVLETFCKRQRTVEEQHS